MIIDCHTHCYPQAIVSRPRKWAEAHGEQHWADLVAPTARKSIQDWADPQEFIAAMDQAGVDRAVLLGWYWEYESTCRWHNEVIAEWVRQAPERFIGFAAILPNENVTDQLERAHALGLCGVGELHPGVQGFDSRNEHWPTGARRTTGQSTATPPRKQAETIPAPLRRRCGTTCKWRTTSPG